MPLLGLVLFGDPAVAKRFYKENLAVAMDRLAQSWQAVEARYGMESESSDVTARAVMGIALFLALESHFNRRFDQDRALGIVSDATAKGFFPSITPSKKR